MSSPLKHPLLLLLAGTLVPGCRFGYEEYLIVDAEESRRIPAPSDGGSEAEHGGSSGGGSSGGGSSGGGPSGGGASGGGASGGGPSGGGASGGSSSATGGEGGGSITILGFCEPSEESVYFQDLDEDGFGNAAVSQSACEAPPGFVEDNTDCADEAEASPTCNHLPGSLCRPEDNIDDVCDGADNDCDGQTDEDCLIDNPSGLILWLDAADQTSFVLGEGISQWRDKSPLGNHLSAGSISEEPSPLSGVHPTQGVVHFDGLNDSLIADNSDGDFDAESFSLYMVLSATWGSPPSGKPAVFALRAAETRFSLHVESSLSGFSGFNGSTYFLSPASLTTDQLSLIEVSLGPEGISSYQNGSSLVTEGDFSLGEELRLPLRVGAAQHNEDFFEGNIAEVLMFNRQLTEFERAALAVYLQAKWQIADL